MAIVAVEVRGLKELRRALRREPLLEATWRDFLTDAVAVVEDEVTDAAPAASSGRLGKSIKGKVTGKAVARQGKVTANATRGGFRYGYALNASDRYHHRGSGKSTRGWFDEAGEKAQPKVDRLVERLGDDIARAFDR